MDKGEGTFNPSGIAIHPITNDVYMIGTKGTGMLVCCGWDGRVKGVARLDKDRVEQPEGIAFAESGELIMCSEGAKGKKGKKARRQEYFCSPLFRKRCKILSQVPDCELIMFRVH